MGTIGRSGRHAARLALAVGTFAIGGCAFVDVPLYPAEGPRPRAEWGTQRSVYVGEVVDHRRDKSRCGMQKNGMGIETAKVLCTVHPARIVTELLVAGLRSAGFRVNRFDPAQANVRIDGQLFQYFVEPKLGLVTFSPEADIYVRLLVSSRSGLVADRDFYAKAEEVSAVGTQSNFQLANDAASRRLVVAMTSAVVALFNRYPELGATEAAPQPGAPTRVPTDEAEPSVVVPPGGAS